jgi:hypothetical protein
MSWYFATAMSENGRQGELELAEIVTDCLPAAHLAIVDATRGAYHQG